MSVYDWAKFRSTKSRIKLHTQLDVVTQIPVLINITNAAVHDINAMDIIDYVPFAQRNRLYRRLWRFPGRNTYKRALIRSDCLSDRRQDILPIIQEPHCHIKAVALDYVPLKIIQLSHIGIIYNGLP